MTDIATLQSQLESLKAARRSGQRAVSLEGFRAEYRDDSEMARAIAATEAEIAAAQGTPPIRNIVIRSKGWSA